VLPLGPPAEAVRQIGLNTDGNASLLHGREIRGLFPPEMAWDPSLASLVSGLGLEWTITDDIPWVHSGRPAPFDWIPSVGGLGVFLRSNFWSNRIAFHEIDGRSTALGIVDGLSRWSGGSDAYIVIALDGETFGHHRKGAVESFLIPFLETLGEGGGARLSPLSELAAAFPLREAVERSRRPGPFRPVRAQGHGAPVGAGVRREGCCSPRRRDVILVPVLVGLRGQI